MSAPFEDGDHPDEQTKAQSHTHQEEASAVSNIYVLSGEADCDHPPCDTTCLGLQGVNTLFQCERCNGVIIVARSATAEGD